MNALPEAYHERRTEPLMVLFKIISRRSWDEMQAWLQAHPGSYSEHLIGGTYAVFIPAGGALETS